MKNLIAVTIIIATLMLGTYQVADAVTQTKRADRVTDRMAEAQRVYDTYHELHITPERWKNPDGWIKVILLYFPEVVTIAEFRK